MNLRGCLKSFMWVEAYDEFFLCNFLYAEQMDCFPVFLCELENRLRALNLGGDGQVETTFSCRSSESSLIGVRVMGVGKHCRELQSLAGIVGGKEGEIQF